MKETILDRLLNVIDRKIKQHRDYVEENNSKLVDLREQITLQNPAAFTKAIETRDLCTINKGAVTALEEIKTIIEEVNDKYKKTIEKT